MRILLLLALSGCMNPPTAVTPPDDCQRNPEICMLDSTLARVDRLEARMDSIRREALWWKSGARHIVKTGGQ